MRLSKNWPQNRPSAPKNVADYGRSDHSVRRKSRRENRMPVGRNAFDSKPFKPMMNNLLWRLRNLRMPRPTRMSGRPFWRRMEGCNRRRGGVPCRLRRRRGRKPVENERRM